MTTAGGVPQERGGRPDDFLIKNPLHALGFDGRDPEREPLELIGNPWIESDVKPGGRAFETHRRLHRGRGTRMTLVIGVGGARLLRSSLRAEPFGRYRTLTRRQLSGLGAYLSRDELAAEIKRLRFFVPA